MLLTIDSFWLANRVDAWCWLSFRYYASNYQQVRDEQRRNLTIDENYASHLHPGNQGMHGIGFVLAQADSYAAADLDCCVHAAEIGRPARGTMPDVIAALEPPLPEQGSARQIHKILGIDIRIK